MVIHISVKYVMHFNSKITAPNGIEIQILFKSSNKSSRQFSSWEIKKAKTTMSCQDDYIKTGQLLSNTCMCTQFWSWKFNFHDLSGISHLKINNNQEPVSYTFDLPGHTTKSNINYEIYEYP